MARRGASRILDDARALDARDELGHLRREFHIPRTGSRQSVYLCGHSLGLMPRRARAALERELERWSARGVAGHFDDDGGWFAYHERLARPIARLTGARLTEVVAMNSLTVNLHLMLASFFTPRGRREKILIEADAFPSDRYAVASQLAWRGLDPSAALIELRPRDPRAGITVDDLADTLQRHRGEIALVWLPGVQFLSGQVLDMPALTAAAHTAGAIIGFDLAHAIGNVPLRLHAWDVDCAVWCSYKYLNGGPGAVGGAFVHARLGGPERPRLAGWWGHRKSHRFAQQTEFSPIPGAEGWQLSNPSIFAMAPLIASLEVFAAAGPARLRRKSRRLTQFMRSAIESELGDAAVIVTPRRAQAAQLSLRLAATGSTTAIEHALRDEGIIVDSREPNLLRLAPVPLYNRFRDVAVSIRALRRLLA